MKQRSIATGRQHFRDRPRAIGIGLRQFISDTGRQPLLQFIVRQRNKP
jgi:hypothetical protein